MHKCTLDEQFKPFVKQLSDEQARVLSASRLVDIVAAGSGSYLVSPSGRVGAVRMPGLQVEVWPKKRVRLAHLMFLLGYAADPGFRPESIDGAAYDELWPVIAESFARLCERALLGGVLQGYRSVEESSIVVKGRIRSADQIRRHLGKILPLEVAYDEYVTDIAENQILRTALRRIRAIPGLDPRVAARLSHLDNRLDGVRIIRRGERLPTWRPTRLNARYASALRLAELVMRNTSAQLGDGGAEIAVFVVSMWKLFEDFVSVALLEAIRERGRQVAIQERWYFDEPRADGIRNVPMSIDLVEYEAGSPVCVYDAKYKVAADSGRYPNADFYQMLAYCTALGIRRAVLVYAQGGEPVVRTVMNSDIAIQEWPLDLSQSPEEMLRSISRAVSDS